MTTPALKSSPVVTIVLALASLAFLVFGGAILFTPFAFYGSTGVDLPRDATLLSDVHGLGGLILSTGVLIGLGVFVRQLAFTSALVGAVAYLSYVAARVLSIAVEGMPAQSVVGALIAELVLGLACLLALIRYRVRTAPQVRQDIRTQKALR